MLNLRPAHPQLPNFQARTQVRRLSTAPRPPPDLYGPHTVGPFTAMRPGAKAPLFPAHLRAANFYKLSIGGAHEERMRRLEKMEKAVRDGQRSSWGGTGRMARCSAAGGTSEEGKKWEGGLGLQRQGTGLVGMKLGSFVGGRGQLIQGGMGRPAILGRVASPVGSLELRRTYASVRENRVASLAEVIPPGKVVDLGNIMSDLRDLELLDTLRGAKSKSGNGFKDAARCLYPLWHTVDENSKVTVTFRDLQAALPDIYGIGWSIIGERLLRNKVAKLASLSSEDKAALLFLQIHGVGPKFAAKFVAAGARTLAGLGKKCELSRAQKIGLRHFDDINRLIPRVEMEKLKSALEAALADADPRFESEILGSYRRGVAFSSDIDLAIRHKKFVDADDVEVSKPLMIKVLDSLKAHGLIKDEDTLTSGPKKFSGLIKLPRHKHFRRIDIRLAPYHSYPYMTLGSSGDALLMKLLRHTAKTKGWCLNEYGMGEKYDAVDENPNGFRPNTLKIVKNEKEIFELLGFPYLKPEDRDFATWMDLYIQAGVDVSYVEKL